MQLVQSLHNREEIARFLCWESERRLYELGDLDDFFWPYTVWYGLKAKDELQQVLLLYTGVEVPTLLCVGRERGQELLEASKHLLPRRFHAHLLPDYAASLQPDYRMHPSGPHYKYALHHPERLEEQNGEDVVVLRDEDLEAIYELYAESYPGNWFDARMLKTGHYYGKWEGEKLVSVAGIHVYSPEYKTATLGNVTTHPVYRGRGLGTKVCATLCRELLKTVEHIGLNVKADNRAAIAMYEQLGFERVEAYEEFFCEWLALPSL
jgi:ribosomal protein S18 acetylase RimI-like enzyme